MTGCFAAIPLPGAGWSAPALLVALGLFAALCVAAAVWAPRILRRRERKAIQEERERVALEMHDTLAQSFAGIAFQLQAARDSAAEGEAVGAQLEAALEMVRRTHLEIKETLASLRRPPATPAGNPAEALRVFARGFGSGRSPAIHSSCRGSWRRIPPGIAEALLRIGQEAIVNVFRHARASSVSIALVIGRSSARLSITDDGVGFQAGHTSYGMGLEGLSQRAERIGGRVAIASAPGRGTCVSVTAPLTPPFQQRVQTAMALLSARQKSRWQTN